MSLQHNPQRHRDEAPEISGPQRKRTRRLHLTFWERWWAGRLEKGGWFEGYARRVAIGEGRGEGQDAARLQVWLYDHRPAA